MSRYVIFYCYFFELLSQLAEQWAVVCLNSHQIAHVSVITE